ncbi:MAG: DNA mismatch repair protein MutS [Clostridia bacterium]|nr:DNA mismatch repair protein MutS [Clostridia bacterium]
MAEMTPMMRQYLETKKDYPDTILMYRLGDFYEMFFEDAKVVSRELELVLTGRDCGQEERAPMCGVPFHSVDSYIARLVAKGYKVAICEQMEDPSQAKGIVRREVVRVLTPGTVIESNMLDEGKNNYLASIILNGKKAGICFADVSTGSVNLTQLEDKDVDSKIINELGKFMPSEILYNAQVLSSAKIKDFIKNRLACMADGIDESYLDYSKNLQTVLTHFKKASVEDLGISGEECVIALGTALGYLHEVQKSGVDNIRSIDFYSDSQFMKIDISSRRNLELTETMRNREKRGTLLWVLDKTKTAMGKRLMRSWLEQPLISPAKITRRHNAVGELCESPVELDSLITSLSAINDIERLMARIIYETANAKELRSLAATVKMLPEIKNILSKFSCALLGDIFSDIDLLEDVLSLIENSICEDPPFTVREGGMIKDGFNAELDSLRDIVVNGKGYIAKVQTDEQERTGIKKLKIGYNRVFGYYIEVPNSFKELVPEEYIRKQTLANCERYITSELKDLESKVLGAQERIVKLEYEIFTVIRGKVADEFFRIQKTASALASLDVLCSFANVSAKNNYICPIITEKPVINIKDGRHPVVEKMLKDSPFVPNDTLLDCDDNRCAIITGPNMAGKSTYMRQVALIVLMAQCGCFVPAGSAEIGIVDSIFTRVGASDDLASGQSTFMVEMSEVANILKNATSKSLLIFDEIGRGTSTFDGMSIARAVLEHTADKKRLGAKTLFATHYHELTELESKLDGVRNYNIAVKKRGDDITFLRRIVPGGADGSYGIEVAKLAGVPNNVVTRARAILKELEATGVAVHMSDAPSAPSQEEDMMQISFSSEVGTELIEEIKKIDVNTLTPIEAMQKLYDIVKKSKEI